MCDEQNISKLSAYRLNSVLVTLAQHCTTCCAYNAQLPCVYVIHQNYMCMPVTSLQQGNYNGNIEAGLAAGIELKQLVKRLGNINNRINREKMSAYCIDNLLWFEMFSLEVLTKGGATETADIFLCLC